MITGRVQQRKAAIKTVCTGGGGKRQSKRLGGEKEGQWRLHYLFHLSLTPSPTVHSNSKSKVAAVINDRELFNVNSP